MSESEKQEKETPVRAGGKVIEVGKPSPKRLAAAIIARAEGRLVIDERRDDAA